MYTFQMTCDEVPGLPMDDGAVRIFLNTRGRNDDEVPQGLVEFLHYAEAPERYGKDIKDFRVQELASQIEMLKGSQEVGVKYMRLWEELAEARIEGREAGMTDGILESIRNLMKQTGWPLEKALTMLDIPEDEHEKYLKLLEK